MSHDFGVYIHLPYCPSLCPYCDFNSHVERLPNWRGLVAGIVHELTARRQALPLHAASTLYFGGGTPSMAPPEVIHSLIEAVRAQVGLCADAEITLEVNPGTVDASKMRGSRAAGVNRVSLGWQSTHDRLLRVLGRGHTAQQSLEAYGFSRQAGFDNVSLDLIFAVPGQSLDDLHQDLEHIEHLAPEHVSLYALTYKEGTPFHRRRARGTLRPATEDTECDMMQVIQRALSRQGYEQYEVSNYAQGAARGRHNNLYWQGGMYLGLGPGAHSFVHDAWQRGWRWENIRNPNSYIHRWHLPAVEPALPNPRDGSTVNHECIDGRALFCERMMCGLRHIDGVHTDEPVCRPYADALQQGLDKALAQNWATVQGPVVRPTALGLQHADALGALFF